MNQNSQTSSLPSSPCCSLCRGDVPVMNQRKYYRSLQGGGDNPTQMFAVHAIEDVQKDKKMNFNYETYSYQFLQIKYDILST